MRKKTCSLVATAALCVVMTGCASVTISPDGKSKLSSEPNYQNTENFYFWGLTPDVNEVNVTDICAGEDVRQMQAQTTFVDGLLGAITLGIYSPRSVKVWCE